MNKRYIKKWKELIENQINSLKEIKDNEENYLIIEKIINLLLKYDKKVIFIGVGKSGIIAQKAAASFSSIGIPSIYLDPLNAFHGDLGMIKDDNIAILISHSGNTKEIINLIPFLRKMNFKLISITSNKNSKIAKLSDIHINTFVKKENCPHNLAPTISTTTTLTILDSIMVILMIEKGFTKKEFALYHPSGALGKKLTLKISDIINSKKIYINENEDFVKVITKNTELGKGILPIVSKNKIIGIISDGDIRRILLKYKEKIFNIKVKEVYKRNPIILEENVLAKEALEIMRKNEISAIPIIDKKGLYKGVINIYDILNEGIN